MSDPATPTTAEDRPRPFGDYMLERKLGSGGMSTVFLGYRVGLVRIPQAIKILRPELALDPDAQARFVREAQLNTTVLQHPAIVRILDAGEYDGRPYISFEYVDGFDLSRWLKDRGRALPLPLALHVLRVVFEAVEYAHQLNIIHRDLKPANIMLSRTGQVKLADFGVARPAETDHELSEPGLMIGTLFYMSPEQYRRETLQGDAGKLSDIFSLGSVAYELLTGKRPFNGKTREAIGEAILSYSPPPLADTLPNLPPALAAYLDSMLEKVPARRCRDLGQGIALLEQALGRFKLRERTLVRYLAEPGTVEKELEAYTAGDEESFMRYPRRRPQLTRAAAVAAGAVALLALAGWGLFRMWPSSRDEHTGAFASLVIQSQPAGALASIVGLAARTTPCRFDSLTPGTHVLKLELAGYKSRLDTLQLEASTQSIVRALEKSDTPERPRSLRKFSIHTSPGFASVYLDGSSQALADLATITLTEGQHRFRLRNPAANLDHTIVFVVRGSDPTEARTLILHADTGVPEVRLPD